MTLDVLALVVLANTLRDFPVCKKIVHSFDHIYAYYMHMSNQMPYFTCSILFSVLSFLNPIYIYAHIYVKDF